MDGLFSGFEEKNCDEGSVCDGRRVMYRDYGLIFEGLPRSAAGLQASPLDGLNRDPPRRSDPMRNGTTASAAAGLAKRFRGPFQRRAVMVPAAVDLWCVGTGVTRGRQPIDFNHDQHVFTWAINCRAVTGARPVYGGTTCLCSRL